MTGNTPNIEGAESGARRQSRPPKVIWETFCPAPKQSKTVQPAKPSRRSREWMPQPKSSRRLRHGSPASFPTAKSAEAANGSATQHSPKQLPQSASRPERSPALAGPGWGTCTAAFRWPDLDGPILPVRGGCGLRPAVVLRLGGELRGGHQAPGLEQQQDRQEAAGLHAPAMAAGASPGPPAPFGSPGSFAPFGPVR